MKRLTNLTESELLELEGEWWDREDESDFRWVNEGVRLFKRLSSVNQSEIRYKETLAYLLLLQGEEFKMRKRVYGDALKRFKSVVRLDPDNARAHYRLGFLYFYEEEWTRSIDSFQQSLNCHPSKSRNQLATDQKVKAHYYILKATQIILHESLHQVEQVSKEELDVFGEIKSLMNELRGLREVEEKPYQMIVNGVDFSDITEREYEELSDPFENDDWVIFNQKSMNDVTVTLNGREVTITNSLVPLLEFLMRNPKGLQQEEIIWRRVLDSKDPKAKLRQDIRRLRDRLKRVDKDYPFIETIEGGYRWNNRLPYRMFKHYRDVSTDLLLD